MINNERVGWWLGDDGELLRPDPSNLYRFVGNDPTNCTDPTGLGEQPKKAAVPNTDYKSYTWRRTSKGGLIMFYRPAGGKATPEQMDAVEKAADEAINQLETATDLIARNWPAIVELYRDRKEIKPLQLLLQNRDFYEKKMRAAWMQLGYSTETIMNGTALWPSKYGEVRFYVDAEDTAQKDAAYVYAIGVPWIGRTPLTGAVIHLLPEFFRNPKRQPYYLIHEMGRLQGLLYANYDYSPGNTANIYNVEMFDELVAILSNPAVVKAVEERSAQIRQRRGPTKGM